MKQTILSLIVAFVAAMGMQARTFVLVTGVSNYGNEETNLHQSTKDAKRFRELMLTQTKDITILTSKNVTRSNVLEKLRAICNRAQKNDRVMFYYSGHGMPGAIYAYDGGIRYEDIIDVLSTSQAKEKIVMVDACYSGTINKNSTKGVGSEAKGSSWVTTAKANPSQVFFVACRPDEYSLESPITGAGYFTQALLKGMRGKADKNNDRKVTLIELFKYVYGDVLKRSGKAQHPQLVASKNLYDMVVTKWK